MRITRRTAMLVAVVCAAGAALLTAYYLQTLQQAPTVAPEVTKVAVPVPVTDLAAGTRISADKLTVREFPQDELPPGVVTSEAQLTGQILAESAPAGEPLKRSQLAAYSPGAGLSYAVPDGMRAVTVAVDNISGVGGFLMLGDRVDVLANFPAGDEIVTRTVLQDVEVLGVGAEALTPGRAQEETPAQPREGEAAQPQQAQKLPSVTLAVTPQQAQRLILAARRGTLHLALRARSDAQVLALSPETSLSVIGPDALLLPRLTAAPPPEAEAPPGVAPVAPPPPPGTPPPPVAPGVVKPPGPGVEVIRGTSREFIVP